MGAALLVRETPKRLLLGLIWVYQSTLGPALPKACRFDPSYSQYAFAAIERHCAIKGTWLAAKRLSRSHPFGGYGYDPVP